MEYHITLQGKGGHGSRPDRVNNPVVCFAAVYGDIGDENPDEDGSTTLPELNEGDKLVSKAIEPEQKFTQPPLRFTEGVTLPFPGDALAEGASGDAVRVLQEYLSYIAESYDAIPPLTPDGVYGPATREAVAAFQRLFGVPGITGVTGAVTWDAIASVYEDLYEGNRATEGQFPGYTVGG